MTLSCCRLSSGEDANHTFPASCNLLIIIVTSISLKSVSVNGEDASTILQPAFYKLWNNFTSIIKCRHCSRISAIKTAVIKINNSHHGRPSQWQLTVVSRNIGRNLKFLIGSIYFQNHLGKFLQTSGSIFFSLRVILTKMLQSPHAAYILWCVS